MGSDLLHVHEWMPCHNGGKLEHAGQRGHLIPAAKPSQANQTKKKKTKEVIRAVVTFMCAITFGVKCYKNDSIGVGEIADDVSSEYCDSVDGKQAHLFMPQ